MEINKQLSGTDSIQSFLSYFVFSAFFILSVRASWVYLSYLSGVEQVAGVVAVLTCIVLCWWKIIWVLYLFVAFIPLISGIQVLGFLAFAPLLSFAFSIIYSAWFIKRVFIQRKDFQTENTISRFIDVISVIICFSIIACLCEYPFDFVIYRLKFASLLGQEDPFWFMEAGYRALQGIFLYRLFDIELSSKKERDYFRPCLYFHAVTVTLFSFVQLIFNMPDQKGLGSVFSPFQDVHSYGGYVLILFFFFAYSVLKKKEYTKINFVLVLSLLICILVSGSTSTLICFFVVGGVLSLVIYGKQNKIFIVASVLFIIILVINLFPSLVPKVAHTAFSRYAQRLNVSTGLIRLGGRFTSGDQALGIMKEFPLTGSGIGSFFKVSRYYHFGETAHPERIENAHNYYLQFGAELGLPALVLFLIVLFFIFRTGLQSSKNVSIAGLLFGLAAYLLSMITAHHLILSVPQFLFWFCLLGISSSKNVNFKIKYLSTIVFILLFLVLAGHASNLFYSQKKVKGPYEYGFHDKEMVENRSVRWTMKMSGSKEFAKTDILGISVYAMPNRISEEYLSLDIFINDKHIDRLNLKETGFKTFVYHIPGIKNHGYLLRTKANTTFNPYELGLTKNRKHSRDQAVAMEQIIYFEELPKKKYKQIDYTTIGT